MLDQSSKKPKRPRDLNLLSKKIMEIATEGELAEEPPGWWGIGMQRRPKSL